MKKEKVQYLVHCSLTRLLVVGVELTSVIHMLEFEQLLLQTIFSENVAVCVIFEGGNVSALTEQL